MVVLIIIATCLAVIFPAYYMYKCYESWEAEFGGHRVRRSDQKNASYGNPPQPVSYELQRIQISSRCLVHDHAEVDDYKLDEALLKSSDEDEMKELAGRTKSFSPKAFSVRLGSANRKKRRKSKMNETGTGTGTGSVGTESTPLLSERSTLASGVSASTAIRKSWGYNTVKFNVFGKSMRKTTRDPRQYSVMPGGGMYDADHLDMDHQYIPFLSYFWSVVFVGHHGVFLWINGCIGLKIRDVLHRWGWVKPKPHDPSELAAKLVLESSLAVHYAGRKGGDDGGDKNDDQKKAIGGFFFSNFPYVKSDGSFATAELLSIEIDLDEKRMLWAKMDDKTLTAEEAVILLWYYGLSANHVKLHALSNWAINLEPKQIKENPFPAQNSLVTTIYNYFGYTAFATFFSTWQSAGLLSKEWKQESWIDTVNLGLDESFFAHPQIRELVPYSEFVDFHVKLRPIFMKEFAKVKGKYFPGCHGEAMFIGTVMHSLEHTFMDWNLEDVLWLDTSHPEYGRMAEMGRIVKVGFVKDLPGLLFHKRFKGAKHPFYDKIYEEAAKINVRMADNMDTCVVK